jgi:hypothetical protein
VRHMLASGAVPRPCGGPFQELLKP